MANIDINDELKPVPEIGKYYHFWDDGKSSPGRHYICKCERIITPEEAKSIMVEVPDKYMDDIMYISLYEHWYNNEVPSTYWLFSDKTDYFVECSCPEYDKHNLWFVRTHNGGWFSMDIQNFWQGGRLDVDGKIFEEITNYWELNEGYVPKDYVPADETHYHKRF